MSNKIATFYDDSLTKESQNLNLSDSHELLKLEEEIEILREQVESSRLLLHQQNQTMQEIVQELLDTKHELMRTNRELCIVLQPSCKHNFRAS
ncbi:hypothetical protein [Chroococcidiopsis sp.]|uniref:hypothetical protein n=1 Tax=Chroococcidiopsis sp. TaxID=3088168 RepID=UPI003F3E94B7